MSINQSDLSASQYGYDFVVATTLQSLNSTMFEFINGANFPATQQFFWTDASGDIAPIDLATLMATAQQPKDNPSGTGGVDPSSLPNWDGSGTPPVGIAALGQSSFQCGFTAQIGIPPGFALPGAPNPQNLPVLPNMVSFNQTSMSVVFNLYCSTFQVFQPAWGRDGVESYLNQSQPSGSAWFLQTYIPINQILNNTDLPPAVQAQLNALGDAFSVQQLFIDLDQPSKVTQSSINFAGIQPGTALTTVISSVFADDYCTSLKTSGMPALGYTILPNTPPSLSSSLQLGSMEIEIVPYADPSGDGDTLPGLDTFNYLCSQTATVPAANQLIWNWFDTQADADQYSGVIAVNRTALAGYLAGQLSGIVSGNCWQPAVDVSGNAPGDTTYYSSWSAGTAPAATVPPSGATILSYNYQSANAYDSGGSKFALDYGSLSVQASYSLQVSCAGNTITIVQNQLVYAEICWMDTDESGNYVNKTITDVYTLSVGQQGNLVVSAPQSTLQDNSDTPSSNWLTNAFTGINDISSWMADNVSFIASDVTDIPLSSLQQFVFPGGNTFSYADVAFSDNQDLVSHVTYNNPD